MLSWDLGHNLDENHRLREKIGQSNLNGSQTNPPRDVLTRCCSRSPEDTVTLCVQGSEMIYRKSRAVLPDNEPNTDWISREGSCPSGRELAVQTRLYTLLLSPPPLKWIPSSEIMVSIAKTQVFAPWVSDIAQSGR